LLIYLVGSRRNLFLRRLLFFHTISGESLMIKFCDLFSGTGGFHLGVKEAFKENAECVFASEWDKNAQKTYTINFPNTDLYSEDITLLKPKDLPDFDLLCGGFPCQPFSLAGKQEGFAHPTQGTLFFTILKIIQEKKPRVVFLENVRNILSHDKGRTFRIILQSLTDTGYTVKYDTLCSSTHGDVPQERKRVFIVAFRDMKDASGFNFPSKIIRTKSLADILISSKDVPQRYYQTNLDSPSVPKMIAEVVKLNTIYQYRRYYIREIMSGLCPTLTANMGSGGHNVPLLLDERGVRKLTPRECFRLQGFPEQYILVGSDSHLYKQAGNAVTVSVITEIAKKIKNAIITSHIVRI
jgi:DNA (cytosine-5)-methyltransferase 1